MLKISKNKSIFPKLNFSSLPFNFSFKKSLNVSPVHHSLFTHISIKNKDIKSRHFSTSIKNNDIKSPQPTPPLQLLSDFINQFKSQDGNLGKNFYFQDLNHTISLIIQTIQSDPNNIKNPLVIEAIFLSLYVQHLDIAKATNHSIDARVNALRENTKTPFLSLIRASINKDPSLKDIFLSVFHDTACKVLAEIIVTKTLSSHPHIKKLVPHPQDHSRFINPVCQLFKKTLSIPKINQIFSPSNIVLQTFGVYFDYAVDFSTGDFKNLYSQIFFLAFPELKETD